ncbi:MAG: type II toxin-antitoxin system PemK/MazF family toxin [Candidatus Pacebacteria bacterium]|nr:type II toxin-antitoxin system PemK/MazF family toxin [Candidatus Paceibacterota bacterium]
MLENDENQNLIKDIADLTDKYKKLVSEPNKIASVWKERLKLGKNIIEWSIRKYKICFKGGPQVVKKKYIFYCELGFNIGSEQQGRRPVVILQNDKGNSKSPITIVAPISTHRGLKIIEQLTSLNCNNKLN